MLTEILSYPIPLYVTLLILLVLLVGEGISFYLFWRRVCILTRS